MDLNPEQLERLRRLDNRGKPVCPRFKDDRNVTLFLGHIEDEIEVFTDEKTSSLFRKSVVRRSISITEITCTESRTTPSGWTTAFTLVARWLR
jgi:hypothetical protein